MNKFVGAGCVCRVCLPNENTVVRVSQSDLQPLMSDMHPKAEVHRIAYITVAAKVSEVLAISSNALEGQYPYGIHCNFTPISDTLSILCAVPRIK